MTEHKYNTNYRKIFSSFIGSHGAAVSVECYGPDENQKGMWFSCIIP